MKDRKMTKIRKTRKKSNPNTTQYEKYKSIIPYFKTIKVNGLNTRVMYFQPYTEFCIPDEIFTQFRSGHNKYRLNHIETISKSPSFEEISKEKEFINDAKICKKVIIKAEKNKGISTSEWDKALIIRFKWLNRGYVFNFDHDKGLIPVNDNYFHIGITMNRIENARYWIYGIKEGLITQELHKIIPEFNKMGIYYPRRKRNPKKTLVPLDEMKNEFNKLDDQGKSMEKITDDFMEKYKDARGKPFYKRSSIRTYLTHWKKKKKSSVLAP